MVIRQMSIASVTFVPEARALKSTISELQAKMETQATNTDKLPQEALKSAVSALQSRTEAQAKIIEHLTEETRVSNARRFQAEEALWRAGLPRIINPWPQ